MPQPNNRRLIAEALITTAVFIALLRLVLVAPVSFLRNNASIILTLLAIYGPVMILRWRKRPIDFLERSRADVRRALVVLFWSVVIIYPLFLIGAHFGAAILFGAKIQSPVAFWPGWVSIGVQTLLVAMPEEFFFRGYVQTTLDRAFGKPWRLFGAQLGWGWLVTALVFAFAHSVMFYQWWHFAIFFPALAFGYLRARTGGLIAPTGFHALANLVMWWVTMNYR